MASVTFDESVGGDGSTITDDANASTGLKQGGHRTRFVPALAQTVAVAGFVVSKAGEASDSADAAAASAVEAVEVIEGFEADTAAAIEAAAVAVTEADRATNAANAAEGSKEIYASTADALSNGVYALDSLVAGSGGTDGTFALAFSGGAGSGAAGWFTVVSGAISAYEITARGRGYTSAPTVSFAASSGLTGASATAVIAANRDVGQSFLLRSADDDLFREEYIVEAGPVATATGKTLPSTTKINEIEGRINGVSFFYGYTDSAFEVIDADGYSLITKALDSIDFHGYSDYTIVTIGPNGVGKGGSVAEDAAQELDNYQLINSYLSKAYSGEFINIFCFGDSLTYGTGGLAAIDALHDIGAAAMGEGGPRYVTSNPDTLGSVHTGNLVVTHTGWQERNQSSSIAGNEYGLLRSVMAPVGASGSYFIELAEAARSHPRYDVDEIEVFFVGQNPVGQSNTFQLRVTDNGPLGAGLNGDGAWQSIIVQQDGDKEVQSIVITGFGAASGRWGLEIDPPATISGVPLLLGFDFRNSAGGFSVTRCAIGGFKASDHVQQDRATQIAYMQSLGTDAVMINLGENDYATDDQDFLDDMLEIVGRVREADAACPIFIVQWFSIVHSNKAPLFEALANYKNLQIVDVRDIIPNLQYSTDSGVKFDPETFNDPHINAKGARYVGSLFARYLLIQHATQSLRIV